MSEAAAQQQQRPPWVILAAVPRVAPTGRFPSGEHVSDDFNHPPSVSYVTMSRWVCRDETTIDTYPYVVAVDPSGVFLLFASQGRTTEPVIVDRPDLYLSMQREFYPSYFLCHPYSGAAGLLPDPDRPILHHGNIGLIANPWRAHHYMVAELQPIGNSEHATLLCYSTAKGRWAEKELVYSPHHPEHWGSNGVVSLDGKLWWVDLSYGLLACDPFARRPVLLHVPLPDGCALPAAAGNLEKIRCVKASGGKLRYVQIHCPHGDPKVSMWTLADPERAVWDPEYVVPFEEIWADESYRETGLERKVPALALVHPWNPDVVYFWQNTRIFALDVPARRVLECESFEMDFPRPVFYCPRFVHAWELPSTQTLPRHDSSSTIRSPSSSGSESDEELGFLSYLARILSLCCQPVKKPASSGFSEEEHQAKLTAFL